ncbi:hypothetical protein PVK06_025703 [Gossypium arboreum]|uniref:Uncharacterized protein n=1 Tax=Gossypium arboreum TaxID=29729 RepID=A0ABR0NVR1_GOSAR|nr:hypothetical protein PVK06_025703 [Gossypium arboreum]
MNHNPPLFNQQSNQTQIIDIDEPIQDLEDLDLIPIIDLNVLIGTSLTKLVRIGVYFV